MSNEPVEPVPGAITALLDEARGGRPGALDDLFSLVYDDLRLMARGRASNIVTGRDSLNGTALVHAACVRLRNDRVLSAENRKHFFFLFLRAMNDALVEQTRADMRLKRGGGEIIEPLAEFASDDLASDTDIQDLRSALRELAEHDRDGAEVVMLRFLAGRSLQEAADLMGCTFAQARSHWDYARAWLLERMGGDQSRS